MAFVPSESENIRRVKLTSKSSCSSMLMVHFVCLAQVVSTIYSVSVDESTTVHCLYVIHDMHPPVKMRQKPIIDCLASGLVAQSELL